MALKRRKEYVKIDIENKSISKLEAVYHQLITERNKYKQEVKRNKDNNLIELYPYNIILETEEIKK